MSSSKPESTPPMGEAGKHPAGADVGGIRANADGGMADALQASAERKDAAASGRASTGDATGSSTGPVLDAGVKSKAPPPPSTGAAFEDEDDEWRHAPVEPRDESNPLKSLGKAIGDTVTGSEGSPPGGIKPSGGKP